MNIYNGFIQCEEGEWHNMARIIKFAIGLGMLKGNTYDIIAYYNDFDGDFENKKITVRIVIKSGFKSYDAAMNYLEIVMKSNYNNDFEHKAEKEMKKVANALAEKFNLDSSIIIRKEKTPKVKK